MGAALQRAAQPQPTHNKEGAKTVGGHESHPPQTGTHIPMSEDAGFELSTVKWHASASARV